MRLLRLLACSVALSASAADKPVPVQEEPMHKTVFENEYLRVIDVRIPPGETSLYHIHVVPSVIVYLTQSTNRSESWPDQTILTRDISPGQSRYAPYDEKPLTHRVTNTGTGLFRVYDIELLKKPSTATLPPLAVPHATLHWEEKRLRSSGIALAPNTKTEIPPSRCATLVVATAGKVQLTPNGPKAGSARTLNMTDYQFYPAQTRIQIENSNSARAEMVFLELKD